jgi:hypothetical protein
VNNVILSGAKNLGLISDTDRARQDARDVSFCST